jgi:hypothetical protein
VKDELGVVGMSSTGEKAQRAPPGRSYLTAACVALAAACATYFTRQGLVYKYYPVPDKGVVLVTGDAAARQLPRPHLCMHSARVVVSRTPVHSSCSAL